MSWNNAYEKRKFEEKQKKQAEKYRALGMTEEQIKEMYEFDYAQFKSERRFHMHFQNGGKDCKGEDYVLQRLAPRLAGALYEANN